MRSLFAAASGLLARLGMTARIVLIAGAVGTLGTVGCLYAVVRAVEDDAQQRANQALEANLALLRSLGTAEGRTLRVDGERLLVVRRDAAGTVVETPLNGRNDIVDEVKRILGGVATIFRGDTRVATNVTRPDGSRGVGTTLAPGPARDAVFGRGETYRGVNEILGRRHFTIYEPIRSEAGQLIGIWFVGLPVDEFQANVQRLEVQLLIIAGTSLAVAAVVMIALIRWQLRPLVRLRRRIEAVASGDHTIDTSYAERGDEIGAMARAVEVFRQNAEKLVKAEEEREALERRANASRAEIEERLVLAVGTVVDAAKMGDFSLRAEASAELGRLSALVTGLNAVTAACEGFLDEADRALRRLAEGDLSARMDGDFDGRLAAVAENFNRAAQALSSTIDEVKRSAEETQRAAEAINGATRDLSSRTESQAASLEETSAAVEEIAKTVAGTATTVDKAAKGAEENSARAAHGSEVARKAVEAIDRVDAQAKKIVEIVGVMDGLAFQTNLLALNASVEAARAGDAGRGFAVVANEVRRLAQQSAEAARDVRTLIAETNAHVDEGVALVKTVGEELGVLSATAKDVAHTFAEIRHATREQSTGIDEIARALQQMDEMTQANAGVAERTATNAGALVSTAETLGSLTEHFKTAGATGLVGRRRVA